MMITNTTRKGTSPDIERSFSPSDVGSPGTAMSGQIRITTLTVRA